MSFEVAVATSGVFNHVFHLHDRKFEQNSVYQARGRIDARGTVGIDSYIIPGWYNIPGDYTSTVICRIDGRIKLVHFILQPFL